jgi:hypothetical protein
MPVANHPSAAIRKHEFRGRDQKRLELRLDRLGDQPTRAGSQNFGERIVDRPFLSKGDNSILGHGVTLLLGGSGGLITNPVTPPSSHRHPVHRIAPLIAQPIEQMTRAAIGELLLQVEDGTPPGGQRILFPPRLIERSSCGPPLRQRQKRAQLPQKRAM